MKRTLIALMALLISAGAVGADTGEILTKAVAAGEGALFMIEFTVVNKLDGSEAPMTALGICIDAKGYLMTAGLNLTVDPEDIKAIDLIVPGVEGKRLKAKLLGIDMASGLTFVQATESHTWNPVRFAQRPNLAIGEPVASVGLLSQATGYQSYYGAAYISSRISLPDRLVLVTGGELTVVGSPVFSSDGRVIGLVWRQLQFATDMETSGRRTRVGLTGREVTKWFTPIGEFAEVLKNIPVAGRKRRASWMGALVEPVSQRIAEYKNIDTPALEVKRVFPGYSAAKAGMKPMDIIVAVEGEPLPTMPNTVLVVRWFNNWMQRTPAGQKVSLTVLRTDESGAKKHNLTLAFTPMLDSPQEADRLLDRAMGVVVREKVELERLAGEGATAKMAGLIVEAIVKNSPAHQADLKQGDLVTTANGRTMNTVDDLRNLIADVTSNGRLTQPIRLMVRRGDQSTLVTIEPSTE